MVFVVWRLKSNLERERIVYRNAKESQAVFWCLNRMSEEGPEFSAYEIVDDSKT